MPEVILIKIERTCNPGELLLTYRDQPDQPEKQQRIVISDLPMEPPKEVVIHEMTEAVDREIDEMAAKMRRGDLEGL